MRPQAVAFRWTMVEVVDQKDGVVTRAAAMVPKERYGGIARRQFGEPDGAEHVLEPVESRDMRKHNAFFAALGDHYDNLPEAVAFKRDPATNKFVLDEHDLRIPVWPTEEHFRKWLLIETGYCEVKEFQCVNREHARRLAFFIRTEDSYARIGYHGETTVVVKKPLSQSLGSMKSQVFNECMKACLDLAEALTGVPRGVAMKNAGRSA